MASDRTTRRDHPADHDVTVQLSDCGRAQAEAVFDALDHVFEASEEPVVPVGRPAGREPTVWMATFDSHTHRSGGAVGAPRLTTPVEALLTGDHQAVAEVEKALEQLFEIRSTQSVSGEHEKESRLLLAPR